MPSLNIIELNVDTKIHGYARVYASLIEDEYQRKRAYAAFVGLFALSNVIEKTKCKVQKSMTVFRQPKLNEEFEIADFYVNNWHIDVRVLVDGDAVLLPKKHFDNNILPDFYAVVKVDKGLNNAELLGFVDPKVANKQPFDYYYFATTLDSLISYNDFLSKVENLKEVNLSEEEHQNFKEKYLSLLDEELDKETKSSLLRHLFSCPACRTEFCCFTGFEMVSCNMGKYPEIMDDQTLNIIGAVAVDNPENEDKEQVIDISGKDDISPDEQKDEVFDDGFKDDVIQDEVLDEIIEDEFGIVETVVDPEELKVEDIEDDINKHILTAQIPENNLEIDDSDTSLSQLEKGETVSDILDELFSIDEVYEETKIEEKGIDIEPKSEIEEISEIEDIEDIENFDVSDSENDDYIDEVNSEIDVLKDEELVEDDLTIIDDTQENSKEFEYPDEESLELKEESSDFDIQENDFNQPLSDNKDEEIAQIDINNVIVDYDEQGNPIYSYITEISDDTLSVIDDDIKVEDEAIVENDGSVDENYDILDEQYEIYMADNAGTKESSQTSSVQDIQDEEDDDNEYEDYDIDEDGVSVSEFDDENYVDETDESIPEERIASGNPFVVLIVLLVVVVGSVFGGFKLYQHFVSSDKTSKVENVSEKVEENGITEIENLLEQENSETGISEQQAEKTIEDVENSQENVEENTTVADVDKKVENDSNLPNLPEVVPTSGNIDLPPLTEKDLLPSKTGANNVNKSMASAFSVNSSSVTVKNINWLCTPQLFTDPVFKAFLQEVDSLLKMNIRKNILNVTETPTNTAVSVKMAIDNNANIEKIVISESSGSEQIDTIVLQSINESLIGKKSPILNDGKLKADRYYVKVVVNL